MIKTIAFILVLLYSSFAYSQSLATPSSSSLSINGANAREDVDIGEYDFSAAELGCDTMTCGTPAASINSSIYNFSKTSVNIPESLVSTMIYNENTVTSSAGSAALPVTSWTNLILTGGDYAHSVALFGQTEDPNGNVSGTMVGTEGKAKVHTTTGTGYGVLGIANLDGDNNTGSTAIAIVAQAEEFSGRAEGIVVGAQLSASLGAINYDLWLAGAQNILAQTAMTLDSPTVIIENDATVKGIIDINDGTLSCTLALEEDGAACTGGSAIDVGSTAQLCVVCN